MYQTLLIATVYAFESAGVYNACESFTSNEDLHNSNSVIDLLYLLLLLGMLVGNLVFIRSYVEKLG